MKLEVISNVADFLTIKDDWNRLSGNQPLLRHEWHCCWWKHFAGRHQLAIAVVREANRIVAIAPWYIAHDPLLGRVVRFLGSGKTCTDYQRILTEDASTSESVRLIAEALCATDSQSPYARLDRVELEGVRDAEPTIELLVQLLGRQGFRVQPEPLESSWATDSVSNWREFHDSLPKRMRRKLGRVQRRIEQAGHLRFRQTSGQEEFHRKWPVLVELHQKRFSDQKGLDGCFACPDFTAFLSDACRQLAATDRASIHWAELDGRPFVAQLHLHSPGTSYMYQSGFDPAYADWEPGFLLYFHVLREQFSAGTPQSLDFLRGNEPYKAMWNAREIPLWRIHCIGSRWTSRLRQHAFVTGKVIKRFVRDRQVPHPEKPDVIPAP